MIGMHMHLDQHRSPHVCTIWKIEVLDEHKYLSILSKHHSAMTSSKETTNMEVYEQYAHYL